MGRPTSAKTARVAPRHAASASTAARVVAWAAALVAAASAACWTRPASAAPIPIQVRGGSQLRIVATSQGGDLTIRGELLDDTGGPIAAGSIVLQAYASDASAHPGAGGAVPPPVALSRPIECAQGRGGRGAVRHPSPARYVVETDERGTFCVRASAPVRAGTIHARFEATKLYEGTELRAPVATGEESLARSLLRFEPAVDPIELERATVAVSITLRIERPDVPAGGDAPPKREGLVVRLEDEHGRLLAKAPTGGDGRARMDVKTADLSDPGAGELHARFDGTPLLGPASASQHVLRTAGTKLSLARPIQGGDPADGILVEVEVASSRGTVTDGVVEATRGGESIGAAPVEGGVARVVVSFEAERAGAVPVTLRYLPSSPWWRPGPPLSAEVPVRGPGPLRQILLGVVILGIAAWVVGGWRRSPAMRVEGELSGAAPPPSGRPGVQVLAAQQSHTGWRGTVVDAHEGTPIAGAELIIVAPTFRGDGVVARTVTDDRGAFVLEASHDPAAQLVVEAPMHARYEQSLPQPSLLSVALVTRRRALLDRLVRWARKHGPPYDGPPEPTPGHVRRSAVRASSDEVERWARGVEAAAFGPDAVDRAAEHEVRSQEPRGR